MRIIRTIALGASAGALVLGMAAPAMAADPITELPAKASLSATADPAEVIMVSIPDTNQPEGLKCGPGVTWKAWIPGRQDAVMLAVGANAPARSVEFDCAAPSPLALSVTVNPDPRAKKNAVVKFIGVNSATNQKAVMTLVVKVTNKAKVKPSNANAKSNKPADND
jgi:hypothetical protein